MAAVKTVSYTHLTVNADNNTIYRFYGAGNDKSMVAANDSNATINGVTISDAAYGGCNTRDAVTNNNININESKAKFLFAGFSHYGDVTSNKLNINNSTINYAYGGYSDYGNANNNSITINNSSILANPSAIFGGYSVSGTTNGNPL